MRTDASTDPILSIVIVCYRQWAETAQLVRQLCASPMTREGLVEILVIDNHSPPHRELPQVRRLPGVSVRRWSRNFGFARAVNEGQRLARGSWTLLLNPDVSVSDTFLSDVLRRIREQEATSSPTGIVGLGVRSSNGQRQPSTGPFPTLGSTLARMMLPPRQRKHHLGFPSPGSVVPWVSGCALLARRECLDQMAGLDADFFLYYEDVDLCRRAQERGWNVIYDPRVEVIHYHPLQERQRSTLMHVLTRHALLTYAFRHWHSWEARALTRVVQMETWGRIRWAQKRGTIRLLGQLQEMVHEMRQAQFPRARQRLNRLVRRAEKKLVSRPEAKATSGELLCPPLA